MPGPLSTPHRATGASTRQRILDAAEGVLRTVGLARATTREIAHAAGLSEAALYKHFTGKEELFVAVLSERLPAIGPLLDELAAGAGGRTVEQSLADISRRAVAFYEEAFPIAVSLFAEPRLLQRHRAALETLGTGPHRPVQALAAFLRNEQARGRLRAGTDPDAAAALLLGACFQRAFLRHFAGELDAGGDARGPSADAFATALARTIVQGIGPGSA